MTSHTLFFLSAQLELIGKDRFKDWLLKRGYTESQIDEIRDDMKKENKPYSKIYEAR